MHTNEIQEAVVIESPKEAKKLLNCKRVWVWGEARSWITGALCPEENNIPKDQAVMVDGLADWDPAKGFTWGNKTRGFSRASKTKPV